MNNSLLVIAGESTLVSEGVELDLIVYNELTSKVKTFLSIAGHENKLFPQEFTGKTTLSLIQCYLKDVLLHFSITVENDPEYFRSMRPICKLLFSVINLLETLILFNILTIDAVNFTTPIGATIIEEFRKILDLDPNQI
jgi:hypothetical protein